MLELTLLLVAMAVFLLFTGIALPIGARRNAGLNDSLVGQHASAKGGRDKLPMSVSDASLRRALRPDSVNERYLRQLKQANWYWEPGEPSKPEPKAPFWNLETLWTAKIIGALTWGGLVAGALLVAGFVLALAGRVPMLLVILGAGIMGVGFGAYFYTSPDSALSGAAIRRQRELALEMGYRIPELRADVMAGNTIQRAIRNMSHRPGGPFVEELRRAVAVLDVTKDDTLAMDQLIERNGSNELLIEFANSLKMVSRQGGQIGPVLNVLADLAQQRLRLTIQAQARRNLQEMTRPIGLSSLVVTSLLIIAPALATVLSSVTK